MTHRPHLHHLAENWRRSDLPFVQKVRTALRNNAIKIRNRSECCGHHGEPGC